MKTLSQKTLTNNGVEGKRKMTGGSTKKVEEQRFPDCGLPSIKDDYKVGSREKKEQ